MEALYKFLIDYRNDTLWFMLCYISASTSEYLRNSTRTDSGAKHLPSSLRQLAAGDVRGYFSVLSWATSF